MSVEHSYFVLCSDFGRRGREAIVDPEETRRGIVDRVRRSDYKGAIYFIHWIHDGVCEDVTNEILAEAGFYGEQHPEIENPADDLMAKFDALIETIRNEVEHA
ncbi:MAG TPA: hypothetical protein VIM11_26860 [Tepidisphaeraceae bacterium]|jgi:hypothetical protein